MTKTHPISIRFEPALRAELEKLAEKDSRKLSAYVQKVMAEHVASQKKKR